MLQKHLDLKFEKVVAVEKKNNRDFVTPFSSWAGYSGKAAAGINYLSWILIRF